MKRGNAIARIVWIIAIFWLTRIVYSQRMNNQPEQIACTEEARSCPDGSYVWRTWPKCEFAACPSTSTEIAATRATLTWEFVCLPHTNQSWPQTMECAFWIYTEDQKYYALDLVLLSSSQLANAPTWSKIIVEWLVTPIEMLSSDHRQKYPIVGIISVTSAKVSE